MGRKGVMRGLLLFKFILFAGILLSCAAPKVPLFSSTPPPEPVKPSELVSTTSTDNSTPARPSPEDLVPRISIQELKQKMDRGDDIVIVDTRTKPEYDIDHIQAAVSAPMADIIARKWLPPPGKELILY